MLPKRVFIPVTIALSSAPLPGLKVDKAAGQARYLSRNKNSLLDSTQKNWYCSVSGSVFSAFVTMSRRSCWHYTAQATGYVKLIVCYVDVCS
jgi:hypothetical protein